MKNAIIFHGAGNTSQGNWFPWLKRELERESYKVWVPDLPNSDIPNLNDWLETVFENSTWEFKKDSIFIGHSAGATFILRILERLPEDIQIHKALLVAGPYNLGTKKELFNYKRDMVKDPFHWEKIKKSCKHFYFFYSDNDPYKCGIDQGKILHNHLGGQLILRSGEGHFNLEKGLQYKQFPELLEK